MHLQDLIPAILPIVLGGFATALTAFLHSDLVKGYVEASKAKLSAEAVQGLASAQSSNNFLVRTLVGEAMAYAEQHEAELLTKYKGKAEFVIARVQADPRFCSLGVPLQALENIIEDIFESVYSQVVPGAPKSA